MNCLLVSGIQNQRLMTTVQEEHLCQLMNTLAKHNPIASCYRRGRQLSVNRKTQHRKLAVRNGGCETGHTINMQFIATKRLNSISHIQDYEDE